MPTPSSSLATLRPDLASSLEEFDLAMDRQGFISHRVLPVISVASPSGKFGRIPVKQLLQNRETLRNSQGGYNRGNWTFEPDSYQTEEHGAEEPIDDREAKMYAEYFDAELISTERCRDAVLRNAERRAAALLYNATTFTSNKTTITHEWDDYTNAVPITDVETGSRAMWNACGMWPNALIVNRHEFRNLRLCEQVKEAIQSAGAGSATKAKDITAAMLAQVFDLDEVIIAGGAKNGANPGQAVSFDKIWSDEYAMLARIARTGDVREPCIGRTFHWGEDGSTINGTVERYRDESVRADIVRVRHEVDEKLMYVPCGHLFENVTTI